MHKHFNSVRLSDRIHLYIYNISAAFSSSILNIYSIDHKLFRAESLKQKRVLPIGYISNIYIYTYA